MLCNYLSSFLPFLFFHIYTLLDILGSLVLICSLSWCHIFLACLGNQFLNRQSPGAPRVVACPCDSCLVSQAALSLVLLTWPSYSLTNLLPVERGIHFHRSFLNSWASFFFSCSVVLVTKCGRYRFYPQSSFRSSLPPTRIFGTIESFTVF